MALSHKELNQLHVKTAFAADAAVYTVECARSWMEHPDYEHLRRPEFAASVGRMYAASLEGLYAPFLDDGGRKVLERLKARLKEDEKRFRLWEKTLMEKALTGQEDLF